MTTIELKSMIIVFHLFLLMGCSTKINGHFGEKYCISVIVGGDG